jgi:hypothetical protein
MSTMTIDQLTYRPARPRATVRLTRRGKIVVFLFALLVILSVAFVGAGLSGAAGEQGELATRTITVVPGDTLWDLASQAAHGGDVRAMEQEIKDLNGLDSGMLAAGQHLRIPS